MSRPPCDHACRVTSSQILMAHPYHIMLFTSGRQFVVRVSAVELYNDQCFDLCSRSATNSAISYDRLKPKHIREHKTQGFYVDNLTGARCGSFKSAMRTINAAIRMRTVGATAMNERSSRSHLLITVYIDGSYTDGGGASTFGRLSIVDLAGSERQDNKARAGTSRVRESGFINKSLYTLGKVIANISKGGNTRVPYRDSALTKLLISSLGGECLTTMVACVSPGGDAVAESTRTLAFAMRVKGILCHPVNYVDEREMEVVKLKREIEGLKKENFKLKEMVVEVAQEANMSLGSKGRQHLGLVNEYEAEGWLEGEGAEDGEVEEEDKGEEEDEGDEEELVAVEYHSQDAYSQDAYSDSEEAYSEEEEEGEEEAAAEEELSYSPNPRQQLSSTVPLPSINASKSPAPKKGLFSTATPAALNNTMDSGFQLITVQMELVEARAGVAGGIAGAEETVRVLEKKREALENEMKLVEQLSSIGMPAAEEVEAVQAVSPDSGKKANPFDWNTEEGDSANWQMMWENSLKILADQEETGTSTSPNRRLFGAEKKKKKKKRNKRCPQRQK